MPLSIQDRSIKQQYTQLQTKVGTNGCAFDHDTLVLPTADADLDVMVTGGSSAETVKSHGQKTSNAIAAINGGYFAFGSGPVSYAKGRSGYESPSGNVKGPRACLAFDDATQLGLPLVVKLLTFSNSDFELDPASL
jgi:hypothetical protein